MTLAIFYGMFWVIHRTIPADNSLQVIVSTGEKLASSIPIALFLAMVLKDIWQFVQPHTTSRAAPKKERSDA